MAIELGKKYKYKDRYFEILSQEPNGKYKTVVYDDAGHYSIKWLDELELKIMFNSRNWSTV